MSDKKSIYSEEWRAETYYENPCIYAGNDELIAEVYDYYDPMGDDDTNRFDASKRANLMAAAPEMLALLEDIRAESDYVRGARDGDNQDGPGLPGVLHARLDHVIGKARGLVNTSSVPLPGREEGGDE